jgi:hypothetical protein
MSRRRNLSRGVPLPASGERDWSSHGGDVGSHGNNCGSHGGCVGEGHEVGRTRIYWDKAKQGDHDRAEERKEENMGEKKGDE